MAGPLTLRTLSNTGDTTKGSPLTASEIDNNFINLRDAASITVLDELTNNFDGVTKTFALSYNASSVSVSSPHALMISLGNLLLTPYTLNTYESYVFAQEVDVVLDGDYTVSGSNITFANPPQRAQKFYGRLLGAYVKDAGSAISNIFRPVPIALS